MNKPFLMCSVKEEIRKSSGQLRYQDHQKVFKKQRSSLSPWECWIVARKRMTLSMRVRRVAGPIPRLPRPRLDIRLRMSSFCARALDVASSRVSCPLLALNSRRISGTQCLGESIAL